MGISDEFRKYGTKLYKYIWSVYAENDEGELVVSLWHQYYEEPVGKTRKYIDMVSRWSGNGNIEFKGHIANK